MDDVDFTILAATSVLGDLIEKCPPAEACRDAFDRMSKATVQMCLSTTGSGSHSLGLDSRRSVQTFQSTDANGREKREDTSTDLGTSQSGSPPQEFGSMDRYHRPAPRFDMNLRDLFPQTEGGSRTITRPIKSEAGSNQISPIRPKQELMTFIHSNQAQGQISQDFRSGIGQADGVDSALDPNLNQQHFSTAPSLYPNYELQGMDFSNGTGSSGFDLGFGLGLDFDHDWSDGPQYDLFEGFFFGGSGAGM